MSYVDKLREWYDQERAAGRIIDLKLFPRLPDDPPVTVEEMAKAVYQIVTGEVPSYPMSDEELAAL